MFTVGPVAENCFIARRDGSDRAIVFDPGDEAERILGAVTELGLTVEAVLLTHTHFDHVGAVAPVARATGAPVYVSEIERPVLADIMRYVPFPASARTRATRPTTRSRAASGSRSPGSRSTCSSPRATARGT